MADLYDAHRIELFSKWSGPNPFKALQFNVPGELVKEYDFFEMESKGGVSYGVSVRNYQDRDSPQDFIEVPSNGTLYESALEFLNNEIESRRVIGELVRTDLVDRTTESSREEGLHGPFSRCAIHEVQP